MGPIFVSSALAKMDLCSSMSTSVLLDLGQVIGINLGINFSADFSNRFFFLSMSVSSKKAPWGCLVSMTILPDVSLCDDVTWLGRGEVFFFFFFFFFFLNFEV